jgi:hypothetical protein
LECDGQLFEITGALGAPGFFLGAGQSWQQQRGENANDGNDHQEFDEGEPPGMKWT